MQPRLDGAEGEPIALGEAAVGVTLDEVGDELTILRVHLFECNRQGVHDFARRVGVARIGNFEKGVVDGAAWPAAGMLSMKHFEVAKYRIRPTFGTSNLGFWVNLDKWNGLTKADQSVLLDAGLKTEREMQGVGDAILADEDKKLDEMGLKYTRLTPANYKRVKATWNSSLWDVANKCCGDDAGKLRNLARKAGLTN